MSDPTLPLEGVDPGVQVRLQVGDETVALFSEGDPVEFIEHGLVEAFDNSVRLRAFGLGSRVVDILDQLFNLLPELAIVLLHRNVTVNCLICLGSGLITRR
jgi:hypothetical protein